MSLSLLSRRSWEDGRVNGVTVITVTGSNPFTLTGTGAVSMTAGSNATWSKLEAHAGEVTANNGATISITVASGEKVTASAATPWMDASVAS